MAKTKRRKVWVTFDQYGPSCAYRDRKGAAARVKWAAKFTDSALHEEAVPFTEARPGEVVLSRGDQLRVANEVAQSLVDDGWDSEDAPTIASFVLAALRGGR